MDNETKNEQTQIINEQAENVIQPVNPETVNQSVETETVNQSVETETVNQPVQPETVNQPVQTETVNQPVQTETVNQPVQTETVNQSVETETVNQSVETETVNQPVQPETVNQPVETETVNQPVQPETVNQPVENESKQTENESEKIKNKEEEEKKSDNNTDNCVNVNIDNIVEINLMVKSDLDIILYFLQNDVKLKELISKLNIDLDKQTEKKINEMINFLSKNNVKFDNNPPIKKIIDEIKIVFADGKMDLQDIPNLISIITNILNLNVSSIKFSIDTNTISIFIKLLINALIIEKVIKVNDIEQQMINRLIDSSLLLLNTTIAISKVKCSCLPFCNKKN